MIRRYCDGCGEELTAEWLGPRDHNGRFSTTQDTSAVGIMFEIITGKDGTWNVGDWCRVCIAAAVARVVGAPKKVESGRAAPGVHPESQS